MGYNRHFEVAADQRKTELDHVVQHYPIYAPVPFISSTKDSPGSALDNPSIQQNGNAHFEYSLTMYLMCKPADAAVASVWVPVEKLHWTLEFTVSEFFNLWDVQNGVKRTPKESNPIAFDSALGDFPKWIKPLPTGTM